MKIYRLIALLLILPALPGFAQPRFVPKFIRRMVFNNDSTRKAGLLILPTLTSAPETGLEFGAAGLYSFYTDRSDTSLRVSNIFPYATFTTKGQQRLNLSTNLWLPGNRYHYIASITYINFPFNFYGVGSNTLASDKERVGEKRLKINFQGEKRLGKSWYIGIVAGGIRDRYNINKTGKSFEAYLTDQDRNGGTVAYAGPSLTFDNRNNNTYTTKGVIANAYLNVMQGLFANNNYSGSFFNAEYAQFFSLSKSLVFGVNVQEQSLLGSQSPFYLLPALGNDAMMRGYYNGRYRDKNLIAGQAELRYRLCDRVGLVAFGGGGTVFRGTFDARKLKPNYGGGVRYFFDTAKGLSVRADYGIGEKRPGEPRQSGFYLAMGEAF